MGNEANANWVQRARDPAPVIGEGRDAGERERRMPDAVFQALYDAGLFRLSLPVSLGGEDLDLPGLISVIEEVSRHDGATGWNVMLAAHLGLFATGLPADGARAVFGADPNRPVAGSFAPVGKLTAETGGYRVQGRWPFASNCHHANWLIATGQVAAAEPGVAPERRVAFVPARDCRVLDTWHTTGLRGTGSNDFEIDGVFVPAEHTFAVVPSGVNRPGCFSMRTFLAQAGPTLGAVGLGIARDAIETFKELAGTKTPTRATSLLASQHTTQERVGRAEALLQSARAFIYQTAGEVEAVLQTGEEIPEEVSTTARLAAAHGAQSAAEAVDLMFTAAGGTAVYATSRLDRCFRDVHMVTQHIAVAPSNIEMAGQYYLGLGFQERR